MEKEEFNENMMRLNLYGSKLQEIEQQLQLIDKQISELQATSLALDEIGETKKDTEMMSLLGQNIFVKAKLQENSLVMVDLGSKVFAEKKIDEAKEILEKKIDEFADIRDKIAEQAQTILNAIGEIEENMKAKGKK